MNKAAKNYSRLSDSSRKKIAVLIDPDKITNSQLSDLIIKGNELAVDFWMVGGSLLSSPIDAVVEQLKIQSDIPVLLFPGSLFQLTDKADGILFLSLLSGRNPDFLISKHVEAAPFLAQSSLEVIPTGYLLIESGHTTSVEYMSNTKPVPRNKNEIATATALAGEYLGMKMIYLEAGSGAEFPVPIEMIRSVKKTISIPLMVGGGLQTAKQVQMACENGADIIVVGNVLEKSANLLTDFVKIVRNV